MLRVQISEFKRQLSHYLDLAKHGETLEILARQKPVARVVGIRQAGEASPYLERLVTLGIVQGPRSAALEESFFDMAHLPAGATEDAGVLAALIEERREGR